VDSAGLLFEPGNALELSQQIKAVLGNPQRRAELAKRGRVRAREFSIDRSVEHYQQLYREVCRAQT
jgi:glycosyltransferase involved in cell wall biosynthesis